MDAPPADTSPPAGEAPAAGAAPGQTGPPTVGDRILAGMSPAQDPGMRADTTVHARPGIDIGDPMDSFHVQMRVAELKAEAGLAVSAVQKSSQGLDTLLKSQ